MGRGPAACAGSGVFWKCWHWGFVYWHWGFVYWQWGFNFNFNFNINFNFNFNLKFRRSRRPEDLGRVQEVGAQLRHSLQRLLDQDVWRRGVVEKLKIDLKLKITSSYPWSVRVV
eukprot:COSAG02_NODE_1491_length_12358_cov_52.348014_13_plen_114_part_00